MISGLRHRLAAVFGTVGLTAAAVTVANSPPVQQVVVSLPLLGNLRPNTLAGEAFVLAVGTAVLAVLLTLWPLFKPRPRRILDTAELAVRRLGQAFLLLATVGYFDYTYRLPRTTLIGAGALLLVGMPLLHVLVRTRPKSTSRAVIVGDDPDAMADLVATTELPIIGYVSPPSRYIVEEAAQRSAPEVTDGGTRERLDELTNLGGLSRFDEILVEYDVDTALLAFSHPDRGEFFGTLDTCYRNGVAAMVHRDHADIVLTAGEAGGDLVEVDLDPWDWQDYVVKRGFDVAFAGVGLVLLSPIILLIAAGIKLDSEGPILYRQERTAELGETFTVAKFRSMVPDAEAECGPTLSEEDDGGVDPRVTRVGRVLRQTHLDEIPQLWSILVGDMSVVGPRPERPALDSDIEAGLSDWRRRWFVKPGLTGLAQIRGATGYDPEEKLRHDVEYIRRQSFWFDLKIVVRQIWLVLGDAGRALGD